jgi:predicted dehydrogenase/threonine dehydrogenase-like Zn-dependent dehydrogenase
MKQVVQQLSDGKTVVRHLPAPLCSSGEVLVAEVASLISAGTERYVVDLARKNLFQKARARPDHVARVVQKIRQEGLAQSITQMRAKLDEPMSLGYSASGTVLACGPAVQSIKPGDRVAAAAPHAGIVGIGQNLCAVIPSSVSFESAAYAGIGAVAMQGVRLAKLSLGERVLVIGLGLIGQITVGLLKAHGCRVFGIDLDLSKLEVARAFGMDDGDTGSARDPIRRFSGGYGVDAVIIAAATESNQPIELAADACRQKGRIVLVGVTGLNLPRAPFFQKELEFTVSSSLGPGRGDVQYEEKGIDYPIGHARWTAKRNMEAVLDLIAVGKLPVEKLTTHRFAVDDAPAAYNLITERTEPHLGILLQYSQEQPQVHGRRLELRATAPIGAGIGVSLVGAGNFARLVLMPALAKQKGMHFRGICTAKAVNAVYTGEKYDFAFATTDADEILGDDRTSAIVIATRHDLHASLVIAALRAGKNVFVEKPLCISGIELERIGACVAELGSRCPLVMVGFNRRFAPALRLLRNHFDAAVPLSISYRFAPGEIPANAWPQDMEVGGGRIVGEACHAIDVCVALMNSVPARVFAESVDLVGGGGTSDDRVFITIRHGNGGISNVSYQAGGDRSGPTERLEVFGGGRTAVMEGWDTIEMWAGSRRTRAKGDRNKGHAAGLAAFIDACQSGGTWPIPWEHIYGTTWASLAAINSLRTGLPVDLDPPLGLRTLTEAAR